MADIPDRIVLRRHRDLQGWGNIPAIDDVAWAVMETSGLISFIKKSGS